MTLWTPIRLQNQERCYRIVSISKPKTNNFILLSFLQTWTNAIPQFLSVTRVPRVRIPLVLIAAYATLIKMKNIVLVSVTWIVVQGLGNPGESVVSESYISCSNFLLHSTLKANSVASNASVHFYRLRQRFCTNGRLQESWTGNQF